MLRTRIKLKLKSIIYIYRKTFVIMLKMNPYFSRKFTYHKNRFNFADDVNTLLMNDL